MYRTPNGNLCSQPCPRFHTGYLVLREPPSLRSRWAPSSDKQPRYTWGDRRHTDSLHCCTQGALRRDPGSRWERSRGEEGGPWLAVGVLPSQHSFHPDAHPSPEARPGPHTLKSVNGRENQSSAQGNGDFPVSIPQSGTALPPEPLKTE